MKFSDSGLPQTQLVEDAFNDTYAGLMATAPVQIESVKAQINAQINQQLKIVEAKEKQGVIDPEEADEYRQQLEQARLMHLKTAASHVDQELKRMFQSEIVAEVVDVMNNSDAPGEKLLAALMLNNVVKSPRDFRAVEQKFGTGVADIIAEIQHAQAYELDAPKIIKAANSDVKRAFMSAVIGGLKDILAQASEMKKKNPNIMLRLQAGQEEDVFEKASAAWGADKKLGAHLVKLFNQAATLMSSAYRMEVTAAGDLEMSKGGNNKPPQNTPPANKPKGPTGIGGNVF